MNARLSVFFLVFLLLVPQCFGFWWLFEKPKPPLVIVREKDLNGEDINFASLWAEEAWIETLHVTDLNTTTVNDINVTGDINSTGSIEAEVCFISDCYSSLSDLDNWLDTSGPTWELNGAGLSVEQDIDSDNDIAAGNDLSCVNDLSVGDDADIAGDLNVTGDTGLMGDTYFEGVSTFADDANFVDIGFSGYIFGDGSKLTGISAELDGGFANSVYLVGQVVDGGSA